MGQKGTLRNHNHSTTPGDGGQLSSPTIAGVASQTGTASSATNITTVADSLALDAALN